MTIDVYPQGMVISPDEPVESLTTRAKLALLDWRGVFWWIGDIALAAERALGENHWQIWETWGSPSLIDRCRAVAAAYPLKDRNINATWTVHYNNVKHPNRVALVAASVEAGQTSDENRKNPAVPENAAPAVAAQETQEAPLAPEPEPEQAPVAPAETSPKKRTRWLLCIDSNYYLISLYPREREMAAMRFVEWLMKLLRNLKRLGLSDVVACFDSTVNHRRVITEGWPQPYKQRAEKEPELKRQLAMVPELLADKHIKTLTIEGMEADDLMMSYAAQFDGKVTLLTADKDLRQALSKSCNILQNCRWEQNDAGKWMPMYDWVTADDHVEGCKMGAFIVRGITPAQWPDFQALCGDPVDDIKGCYRCGPKTAQDYILKYGSLEGLYKAIAAGDTEIITDTMMTNLLEFEPFWRDTLRLTTMRVDLQLPSDTALVADLGE
jgi:5'-3' exonuclease